MGRLEVICGPMFSGKTEELIRRIKRAKIAQKEVAVFKSDLDGRYSETHIVSHDQHSIESQAITSLTPLLEIKTSFVVIDEIQFFPLGEIPVLHQLANQGKVVLVAGIDMDYKGIPFDTTAAALAAADEVLKLKAICTICGKDAGFSRRLSPDTNKILVGEKDLYQARCRKHFL